MSSCKLPSDFHKHSMTVERTRVHNRLWVIIPSDVLPGLSSLGHHSLLIVPQVLCHVANLYQSPSSILFPSILTQSFILAILFWFTNLSLSWCQSFLQGSLVVRAVGNLFLGDTSFPFLAPGFILFLLPAWDSWRNPNFLGPLVSPVSHIILAVRQGELFS